MITRSLSRFEKKKHLQASHFKTFSISLSHKLVGILEVGDLHLLRIPGQFLLGEAGGHGSQKHGFSHGTGITERSGHSAIAPAGFNPLEIMIVTGNLDNRNVLAFFSREKYGWANIWGIQDTRGANVNRPLVGDLAIAQQGLHFLARPKAAIKPIESDRIGGELGAREGISNLVIKPPTIGASATLEADD